MLPTYEMSVAGAAQFVNGLREQPCACMLAGNQLFQEVLWSSSA